jgi:hypothetical protein
MSRVRHPLLLDVDVMLVRVEGYAEPTAQLATFDNLEFRPNGSPFPRHTGGLE